MSIRTLIAMTRRELDLFFDGPTGGLEALRRLPDAICLDPLSVKDRWEDCLAEIGPAALVTAWKTPPLPERVGKLEYVCHVGGSVRQLIPRGLIERGLLVSNWGDTISETVAEAALMLTLSAMRRSHYYADLMHGQRGWTELPAGTQSLLGRRVGIHGFGNVVRRLIPMLRPFRTPITVYSAGVPEQDYAEHGVAASPSLEALFAQSEVVIELEALTPSTRGIVTESLFRSMPAGATFVNLGRGAVVDEDALVRIAAEGRIRLALEVFAREPLAADSPFRDLPEVVLFPHIGGPTDDRAYLCGDLALANLGRHARGETLQSLVTLDVYDRST